MTRIMLIDDEESMLHMLSLILKKEGYETETYSDAAKALAALEAGAECDFVLSDIRMKGMDGTTFLARLKEKGISRTVIMMSAYGTMDLAIECMKLGAYDYISKPFKADEIVLVVKKAEERERLRRENTRLKDTVLTNFGLNDIFTEDSSMKAVLGLVKKVADFDTPVLITGESGTGKELVARLVHYSGARAAGPFVAINCGAIPAQLLESELFGYVKGAFTDATRNKNGLFQEADKGTIFLDEIAEIPMDLQVKLLRVLQEAEVRRIGDTKSVKIDARVVAATVKDVRDEIAENRFREDLFYRLNVIEIKLPPLRDRKGDIKGLAERFVEKFSKKFGLGPKTIEPEAMEMLKEYAWPGNVRELENAIERAMILEDSNVIRADSILLGDVHVHSTGAERTATTSDGLSIKRAHETLERDLIAKALEKTNNNKTKAAELLEISFRALLYKIKNYGL